MPELVLGIVALAAVVLSFALAAVALTTARHPEHEPTGPAAAPSAVAPDPGGAPETLSRILSELEQLTVLRERGTLTAKEFATQKAKLLRTHP
jgi:hypothetical protein